MIKEIKEQIYLKNYNSVAILINKSKFNDYNNMFIEYINKYIDSNVKIYFEDLVSNYKISTDPKWLEK